MATLGPELAPQVLAACQKNASEIADALGRAFGEKFEIASAACQPTTVSAGTEEFGGPGLVCLCKLVDSAAIAFLSEASGMLPAWYSAPDASGVSKLNTLSQELGMLVLPEEFMSVDNKSAGVAHFQSALEVAEVAADAGALTLAVKSGNKNARLWVLWPIPQPDKLFTAADHLAGGLPDTFEIPDEETGAAALRSDAENSSAKSRVEYESLEDGIHLLPPFSRSLLKIKVPVTVTLAQRSQAISQILEIVPGAILQFTKSCEEHLTLEVGDQTIAEGECVKVGDKFGLRVTTMVMPEERFLTVRGRREASR